MAFKVSEPKLHLGHAEVLLLSTKEAVYSIGGSDCKVNKIARSGVVSVASDPLGNYIFVMGDNSVDYEEIHKEEEEEQDDDDAESKRPSFMETALKSKIKSSAQGSSKNIVSKSTFVKDFIPNKPLSYKLAETIEGLL